MINNERKYPIEINFVISVCMRLCIANSLFWLKLVIFWLWKYTQQIFHFFWHKLFT